MIKGCVLGMTNTPILSVSTTYLLPQFKMVSAKLTQDCLILFYLLKIPSYFIKQHNINVSTILVGFLSRYFNNIAFWLEEKQTVLLVLWLSTSVDPWIRSSMFATNKTWPIGVLSRPTIISRYCDNCYFFDLWANLMIYFS